MDRGTETQDQRITVQQRDKPEKRSTGQEGSYRKLWTRRAQRPHGPSLGTDPWRSIGTPQQAQPAVLRKIHQEECSVLMEMLHGDQPVAAKTGLADVLCAKRLERNSIWQAPCIGRIVRAREGWHTEYQANGCGQSTSLQPGAEMEFAGTRALQDGHSDQPAKAIGDMFCRRRIPTCSEEMASLSPTFSDRAKPRIEMSLAERPLCTRNRERKSYG